MAATPPPGYTPPPADLPQRGDRATFSNRVDAWVTWFSTVILTQLAAIVANAYANALDAAASAAAALGYRDASVTACDAAIAARDLAQGYRDTALTYRDQAAASAAAAAISATNAGTTISATSTSSVAIGAGTKTFVVGTGKQFPAGVPVIAVNPAAPANYVAGPVVSYTGGTLVLDITDFGGTGTFTNWNLAISGVRGPVGGTAGGTLTSALNMKKGADLASAATIDPWSTGGNFMDLTGNATITAIAVAPQAGSTRTLYVTGTPTLTNNANIVVKGGTATLVAGDEVDLEARSTTQILATVRRGSGLASMTFSHERALRASGTFIPKVTGLHLVMIVGAPGTGAVVGTAPGSCATGSGAGGVCIGLRWLVAGTPYVFTSAAPGPNLTYSGTPLIGYTAGPSTFPVAGYATMQANGGSGGSFGPPPVAGGAGGTASGGDINITGGRGGNITGSSATGLFATGAGAPATQGIGYNGGDVVSVGGSATASGGASTGGKGGDASNGGRGGGAGTGGPGGDVSTSTNGTAGVNLDGDVNSFGLSAPSLAQYAKGWLGISGAGAPGASADPPAVPAFGGASAGHVGNDAARNTGGFAGMGGTASFAVAGVRQPQGPGAGSGGFAGATSGNPTGGTSEGGFMIIKWNLP